MNSSSISYLRTIRFFFLFKPSLSENMHRNWRAWRLKLTYSISLRVQVRDSYFSRVLTIAVTNFLFFRWTPKSLADFRSPWIRNDFNEDSKYHPFGRRKPEWKLVSSLPVIAANRFLRRRRWSIKCLGWSSQWNILFWARQR